MSQPGLHSGLRCLHAPHPTDTRRDSEIILPTIQLRMRNPIKERKNHIYLFSCPHRS